MDKREMIEEFCKDAYTQSMDELGLNDNVGLELQRDHIFEGAGEDLYKLFCDGIDAGVNMIIASLATLDPIEVTNILDDFRKDINNDATPPVQ